MRGRHRRRPGGGQGKAHALTGPSPPFSMVASRMAMTSAGSAASSRRFDPESARSRPPLRGAAALRRAGERRRREGGEAARGQRGDQPAVRSGVVALLLLFLRGDAIFLRGKGGG